MAIKVVEKHNLLKTKKIPNPLDEDCVHDETAESIEDDLISSSMIEQNEREVMRLVDKEIRIMSALDHPHIIHLEEVYEDENRVCFVMELAQGGEVFDRLVEKVRKSKSYFCAKITKVYFKRFLASAQTKRPFLHLTFLWYCLCAAAPSE